jgi:hypothetical protein
VGLEHCVQAVCLEVLGVQVAHTQQVIIAPQQGIIPPVEQLCSWLTAAALLDAPFTPSCLLASTAAKYSCTMLWKEQEEADKDRAAHRCNRKRSMRLLQVKR